MVLLVGIFVVMTGILGCCGFYWKFTDCGSGFDGDLGSNLFG